MTFKKILVGSPVYDGMEYCFERFISSLKNIDYENFEILIIDNSRNDKFFKKIKKDKQIKAIHLNPKEKYNRRRLVLSRNEIIKYALDNNFDFILMMDSDVIPPKNILKELINCEKDIVSGLYYSFKRVGEVMKKLPIAWKNFSEEEFQEISKKYNLPSVVKSLENLPRHLTKEEIARKKLIEVVFPSPGCMLISKKVFSNIQYDLMIRNGKELGDDATFFENCKNEKIRMWCHPKIKCEHLEQPKFSIHGKHPLEIKE
tara:strand:- start:504 stop:1280 length:777 start_codon:yes stop_codon:yes gene_type:complete